MRRDMDLVRNILFEIEKSPYTGRWADIKIEDRSPGEVSYHVMLLHQAGLIDATDITSLDGPAWKAKNLTWQGHEFLDTCRNEGLWKDAKEVMLEKSEGISFELLKQVLIELLRGRIFGAG